MSLKEILAAAPVVPVLVIENVFEAVPLARALVKGGLAVLEVTLRTPAAADCIRAIRAEVEGAIVGSGTVLDQAQMQLSEKLGCAFAVSPGATQALLDAAKFSPVPLLPGASTASEAMRLLEQDYFYQKFFPAEPSGGAAFLAAVGSPLPAVKFCPTGGITAAIAPSYLKLANVITVGGSWMAPKSLIQAKDWKGIEVLAREASKLK
jgi:2-dehydro-3-deoxyphosphogluconate aldolase/(4S)-4-hydroxy-2-oxoglutarate aldolase